MDGRKGVNVGMARLSRQRGGSHRSRVATGDRAKLQQVRMSLELCQVWARDPDSVSRVVSQRQRWRGRWRALAVGLKGWNARRRFFRGDWGY